MFEYISGGLLIDVSQTIGGLEEDYARYFMIQLLDALQYAQSKGIVHGNL